MSTKRNRKSLDDALAQQFIYGEKSSAQQEPTSEKITYESSEDPDLAKTISSTVVVATQKSLNSRLIDKLKLPPKEASVRFTVDLSESLHQRLSLFAATTGMKKAEIVRLLLNDALEDAGF
jgi:hypothetical protein